MQGSGVTYPGRRGVMNLATAGTIAATITPKAHNRMQNAAVKKSHYSNRTQGQTMIHTIKLNPEFWEHVEDGTKKAELRKRERDYQKGDQIVFTNPETGEPYTTKNEYRITHVLDCCPGIEPGYCILSIEQWSN